MLRIITPTSLIAGVILLWAQSIFAASFPQYNHQYSDQYLLNVPDNQDSISTQVYAFGSDSTMRQSFILRTQDPGARQLELNHLFMSI